MLPSFVEAEHALKMSCGQDTHLKLSERKLPSCKKYRFAKPAEQYVSDS